MLGLLIGLKDPIQGYKLANMLDRQLGPAWGIEPKNIYKLLENLESEGLVEMEQRDYPRGSVNVFRATADAERVLDEWMRAKVDAGPRRVQLEARIAFSREQDIPHLERALDEYERDCFRLLKKAEFGLNPPLVSWRAYTMNMTRKANSLHLRAELEWLEATRGLIADWRERGPRRPPTDRESP